MSEEEKKEQTINEEQVEQEVTADVAADTAEEAATETKKEKKEKKKKINAQEQRLMEELAESKDRYARLAAEFDNYKKRTARELDGRYADAKANVWSTILPVVDNFDRAIVTDATTDPAAYAQGVELIYKQLKEIMKANGIEEIEALGAEFDPEYHNAVMHIDSDEAGENQIVEVFSKGYKTEAKVIRCSMVKVAN